MNSHDPVDSHGGPLRDGIATPDDPLTRRIIGCAMEVHRTLGPGLMETTYEEALCIELRDQGLSIQRQTRVPIYYKRHLIGEHRPDLIVEDRVLSR